MKGCTPWLILPVGLCPGLTIPLILRNCARGSPPMRTVLITSTGCVGPRGLCVRTVHQVLPALMLLADIGAVGAANRFE